MISPRGGRPFSLELRSANETCHPLHCMCCTSHKTWQAFLKKELHKNHSSTDRPICISLLSEIRHLASKHLLPKMLFRVGIHEVKILLFIYRLGFRLQMLKITVLLIMVKIHIKYLIQDTSNLLLPSSTKILLSCNRFLQENTQFSLASFLFNVSILSGHLILKP